MAGCGGGGESPTEPPPEPETVTVIIDPTHQDTTVAAATLFDDATGSQLGTGRTTLKREEGTSLAVRVEADGFETITSTVSFDSPHTETIALTAVASQSYTLDVASSAGAVVAPDGLAGEYEPGTSVSYTVSLAEGFENLLVQLDSTEASASGTIVMNRDHQLVAAADTVLELAPEDQHLVDEMRQVIEASDPMDAFRTLRASIDELAQREEPAEVTRTLREARALAYDPVEDAAATREAIQAIAQGLVEGSRASANQSVSGSGSAAIGSGLSNVSEDGVRFIYVNGIWTSPEDIRTTVETPIYLPRLMDAAGLGGSQYPLTQFYNPSAVYADQDLLDTLVCLSRKAEHAAIGFAADLAFSESCGVVGHYDDLQEGAEQMANGLLGTIPERAQPAAKRLADTILSAVRNGWPVVVVAHSQGNLMADEALEVLADHEDSVDLACVGAVSIAAPRRIHRRGSAFERKSLILVGERYEDILHFVEMGADATHVKNDLVRFYDSYEGNLLRSLLRAPFDPGVYLFGIDLHSINDSYLTQGDEAEALIVEQLSDQASAVMEHCKSGEAPNEPPSTSISTPADGSTFTEGDTVTFEGSASDPDGSITSVSWRSDIDGELGTTLSFARNDLSVGTHSIALEAVDDGGATSSDTVSITVETSTASGMWSQISAGYNYTCGITKGGSGYCWGSDAREKLGNGDAAAESIEPVIVAGGHSWVQIDAGTFHTCGVTTEGDAYCWGDSDQGKLGTEVASDYAAAPVLVSGGHTWEAVGVGEEHSCGVTSDGEAYCWGRDVDGALGDGDSEDSPGSRSEPVLVAGGHHWLSVSAGDEHNCGVTSSGNAYCWGEDNTGQLGAAGESDDDQHSPIAVAGDHSWMNVSASLDIGILVDHTCGTTSSGDAFCWGDNQRNQLGTGTSEDASTPALVAGGHAWSTVSATNRHSCGVTTDGDGYCWGHNSRGQLGSDSEEDAATPVLVVGGYNWTSVNAGQNHTCGVTIDGVAYCWGEGRNGELGSGSGDSSNVPIAVSHPEE